MVDFEKVLSLEEENEQLKGENDMLLQVIAQMKVTLDRLVNYYMTDSTNKKEDRTAV